MHPKLIETLTPETLSALPAGSTADQLVGYSPTSGNLVRVPVATVLQELTNHNSDPAAHGLFSPGGLIKPELIPSSKGENFTVVPITDDPVVNANNLRQVLAALSAAPYSMELGTSGNNDILRTVLLPPGVYSAEATRIVVPANVRLASLGTADDTVIIGPISIVHSADGITFRRSASGALQTLGTGNGVFLDRCILQDNANVSGVLDSGCTGQLRLTRCATAVGAIRPCGIAGLRVYYQYSTQSLINVVGLTCSVSGYWTTIGFTSTTSTATLRFISSSVSFTDSSFTNLNIVGGETYINLDAAGPFVFGGTFRSAWVQPVSSNAGVLRLSDIRFHNCHLKGVGTPSILGTPKISIIGCTVEYVQLLRPTSAATMAVYNCVIGQGYTLHANLTLASGTLAAGFNTVAPAGYTLEP